MEWLLLLLFQSTGSIEIAFCPQNDCKEFILQNLMKNDDTTCVFYHITDKDIQKEVNNLYVFDKNHKGHGTPLKSKGLMHHKFCILNKTHSIISSANPTANLEHKNNVILIESKIVIFNLKQELRRLKGKKPFFIKKFKHNGYKTAMFFCQKHDCEQKIHKEVQKASEVKFLHFTFTDQKLAQIYEQKAKNQIPIKGIIEGWQNTNYWAVPHLNQTDYKINKENIQHNKVIITNNAVLTGSLNPTRNGYDNNDELLLKLTDPRIIRAYQNYFDEIW